MSVAELEEKKKKKKKKKEEKTQTRADVYRAPARYL